MTPEIAPNVITVSHGQFIAIDTFHSAFPQALFSTCKAAPVAAFCRSATVLFQRCLDRERAKVPQNRSQTLMIPEAITV